MEELRIILSTIENVSDGALTFAVWWLVKEAIVPMVVPLCIILPLGWVTKTILVPVIGNCTLSNAIMSVTGITVFIDESERADILRCLRDNYKK